MLKTLFFRMSKTAIVINIVFLLGPIIGFLIGRPIMLDNVLIAVITFSLGLEYYLNNKTFKLLSQLIDVDPEISDNKNNTLLFLKQLWNRYNVIAIMIILLMTSSIMFRDLPTQLILISGAAWILFVVNSLLDKAMTKTRYIYTALVADRNKI